MQIQNLSNQFQLQMGSTINQLIQDSRLDQNQAAQMNKIVQTACEKLRHLNDMAAARYLEKNLPKKFSRHGIDVLNFPVLKNVILKTVNQIIQEQLKTDPQNLNTLSRQEAEAILRVAPDGSWLIRYSENVEAYVVSRKVKGQFEHISISNKEMYDACCLVPGQLTKTVAEEYKRLGTLLDADPDKITDLSVEEIEHILKKAPAGSWMLLDQQQYGEHIISLNLDNRITHFAVREQKTYDLLCQNGKRINQAQALAYKSKSLPQQPQPLHHKDISQVKTSQNEKARIKKEKTEKTARKKLSSKPAGKTKELKKSKASPSSKEMQSRKVSKEKPSRNNKAEKISKKELQPAPRAKERVKVSSRPAGPWSPVQRDPVELMARMTKNTIKAMEEHISKAKDKSCYAPLAKVPLTIHSSLNQAPLQLSDLSIISEKGPRPTMEDAHLHLAHEKWDALAVFDGHGGAEVSNHAKFIFERDFEKILKESDGNVHLALEMIFQKIEEEVIANSSWDYQGSTAVICYIDKVNNLVYTATLGDSEANIYRLVDGKMKSIPLSCVRDWLSVQDSLRRKDALGPHYHPSETTNPKSVRFYGTNVSRAFGDSYIKKSGKSSTPAITHKPKISCLPIFEGDYFVLACDGLKDFLPEDAIVETISQQEPLSRMTQQLKEKALRNMSTRNGDNLTILATQIKS
ncbi:SH2 domain-containing protein [Candidatus Protochlamydia phocaeensis]|uniref:SH2 domain-containing protein n=1 Tax=Candidatus Protochlamydia phocaeensis TaxID=1414722 RepID=UPI000837BEED|nr:SH2 domain-containing protein [Candidatus Protochlamydia phocaeensis]